MIETKNVLDPSKFEEIEVAEITPEVFDPKKGETAKIKFTLAKTGMVRIFVRPKEKRFILVKTLVDFEDRKAGDHEVVWDGKDSKGNILDTGKYRITIQAQPLRGSIDEKDLPWDPNPHYRAEMILFFPETNKRVHAHCAHPKDKCYELKLKITSPKNGETVKGKVKIVREVDKNTRGYGADDSHSARFYVDYMVLQENKEEKGAVSEWTWDTTDIPPGKHIITATACDHHDHMGSDSIIINIVK